MMAKRKATHKNGAPGRPWPPGDPFPNHWAEVHAVPWKRFRTCTVGDFFDNRLYSWRLKSRITALMRVYESNGTVDEFVLSPGTDIPNTVNSIMSADPDRRIVIADHEQILDIYAEPGDNDNKKERVRC